jgi:hypothetical protein
VSARVYVIELSPEAGRRRDPRIPWVYVGSSSRDAEMRFAQHRRGYKSSGLVKRFALHLRPDLYEDLPAYGSSKQAQKAEIARAIELAGAGFIAHSDGTSYGKGSSSWAEWDAERLEPVAEHVDAAIGELLSSAFEPLSAGRCAELLHGERGFWISDYIDSADPPPAYGRFPHVRMEVLEGRVATLLASGPRERSTAI